jgi:hypothetical protein
MSDSRDTGCGGIVALTKGFPISMLTNQYETFRYFLWNYLNQVGLSSNKRPAFGLPVGFDWLMGNVAPFHGRK